jgi:hypothetical protein
MAVYTSPKLNLYGELNETFNSADFTTDETSLTIGDGDERYLKLSGGTISGSTTFNNGLTSSATISTPFLTLTSGSGLTQAASQLGYYRNFASAITGGSINNGTVSTPTFNTLSLSSGVWLVQYYHNISCTASITFNSIITGITTSTVGVYNQITSQSTYVSETMATGNKYISGGPYIWRNGGTTSLYAPITMSYTTAGVPTVALGISAIRIA